jgi:hypothetical protein
LGPFCVGDFFDFPFVVPLQEKLQGRLGALGRDLLITVGAGGNSRQKNHNKDCKPASEHGENPPKSKFNEKKSNSSKRKIAKENFCFSELQWIYMNSSISNAKRDVWNFPFIEEVGLSSSDLQAKLLLKLH